MPFQIISYCGDGLFANSAFSVCFPAHYLPPLPPSPPSPHAVCVCVMHVHVRERERERESASTNGMLVA